MSFKKTINQKPSILNRKIHYWGSIIITIPFIIVLISGILLLLKKDILWIQPATQESKAKGPYITLDEMLHHVKGHTQLSVSSWNDISRIDIQPDKGIAKISTNNNYEIQLALTTGQTLQVAYRRSDLIEAIHDGSFFHKNAKYFYSLPMALGLLLSLVTGIILFFQPIFVKKRRARKAHKKQVKESAV